ncbi:MAG TPA: type II secretion system F family protein [Candidatus Omnitrophota bacterium]|nr:type II secretion system F family protein [Candidatus Omnitrophota bacterium]
MPVYAYKAVDNKGQAVKGEMQADNEIALTTELAKLGYLPIGIEMLAEKKESGNSLTRIFSGGNKVNFQELVIFTRQFSTIIKAAVPIIEGLRVLATQSEDPVLKDALFKIIHDVESGISLSKAMTKHPNVFSELYVNTVIAGESAGILDKVLIKLSQMLEEDQETRQNIMTALRYPIMVVIALIAAVVVLSVAVIPQFAKIYSDAKVALPLPTQVMIVISNIILGPWAKSPILGLKILWFVLLAGGAGGLYFLFQFAINTKQGRWYWDGLKFRLPVVSKVYIKITMLRFVSMLNVLYQSGLPVLHTLDIVSSTIGNVVLAREIDKIKRDVADGKGISGGILNSPLFPRLVGYMVSIGEKSGALTIMLDSLYDFYYLEVKTTVKNLTTMIEPIMTSVLGGVVMGMALAIFLPMWKMIQVIKQS